MSLPRGNVGRVILSHVIVVVSSHIHLFFFYNTGYNKQTAHSLCNFLLISWNAIYPNKENCDCLSSHHPIKLDMCFERP